MSHKIIIGIEYPSSLMGIGHHRHGKVEVILQKILELRKWCHENAKSEWRTYLVDQAPLQQSTRKAFAVFDFDHQKDAMLFRLYTGK